MDIKLLKLIRTNILRKIITAAFICGCSVSLYSQGKITGKVSDESGTSIAGVSVVIKGTNVGVSTGTDGSYSINTTGADNVLVFSLMGFTTHEAVAGGRTVINVTLVEESEKLDEVVVVGYGTQKKVNLTGSVSSISAAKIENRSTPNLSSSL
ncbi:MAG: carboxypeptidase-like regulatory domain-containing protein, partial [Prevotellaceae bacterium]|nr:carboxypeptidase-like regulatory domain-containing protein [Prevotellaceae bacterium]